MAAESPKSAPRRAAAAAAKNGAGLGLLSPRFLSAAEMAGWDEESLLLAALVVEDTPVRESRRKRRPSPAGGSAGSNTRKRRSRRPPPGEIPPVMLALDDEEEKPNNPADGKKEIEDEQKKAVVVETKQPSRSGKEAVPAGELPCMDRLREELSCAICLEICFEPSTTPCGHSFCVKCLKHAASKCGKRCPKCRQLISNSRSYTINTVLWNTIQLLFPSEVEARRSSTASCSASKDEVKKQNPPRSNTNLVQSDLRRSRNTGGSVSSITTQDNTNTRISSNASRRSFTTQGIRRSTTTNNTGSFVPQDTSGITGRTGGRSFVQASQLVATSRVGSANPPSSDDDAALAYRLQQEEFATAFESEEGGGETQRRNAVSAARDSLRAMASRAVRLRARGWPL
ncbi:uncharacterized protein LOC100841891 [Brachypodium distachyon]|uniref:RING-type E3 ubiquitin transferase n=1 Tax=Brachypodium distachyon TaxID=15368 RepID=A0A0Q3LGA3_BRADI|nr:uncharacterized protein LOC100841891 [Brachypodium distachyon]KQJ91701.1 hypothetical protein BRADI_4g39250v3 [Brachypodium distachyon]|eukprot:XP_003578725.1 uncharacterized protein LOC100841891 [Brachypodium distachyon]